MEYVVIKCNAQRNVLIDKQENGATNDVIRIGAGKHSFSLSGDKDFSPKSVVRTIKNTSVIEPISITFTVTGND